MRRLFASFAVVLLAAGCGSDVPGDPAGPVKLVRIMVQDSLPQGVRGVAMDLLDTPGSPLTTAHACSDSAPCVVNYTFQHVSPDVSCSAAGFCNDPIAAGLAPLVPPETHRPGEAGGTQIRLVFNKLLPASVDTAKVMELDDASGAAVAGTVAWDPAGSQDESSDLIIAPYGPALVFRPTAPLHASATYTIKVNAALVTDRDGNPMADQNGVVVAGTYTKSFTTEGLLLLPQTTPTKIAGATAVTLTPDDIVQLGFNAPAASTACTVTTGGAPVTVTAYPEAGADVANCAAADTTLVNFVAVDGTGVPVDWAAGDYTVSCDVTPAGGGAAVTVAGSFTVAGTAVADDPLARDQHVVCQP
jgi:hypothetical protein